MKKYLVSSALMAVACMVQANSIHWGGTLFAGGATASWTDPTSWADPNNGDTSGVPGAGDDVIIQRGVYGGPFDSVIMPVLSSSAAVNTMVIANNGDGSLLDSQLDMVAGADLTIAGNLTMADFLNSTATLNLSGDAAFTSFGLIMGNGNSSTSVIHMSGTSSIDIVALVFGFGTGASRSIIMDGDAEFRTQGAVPGWENTLIIAAGAGDYILATDIGGGVTEYTVIPITATLMLQDSFATGGVATTDLNYNLAARQAGTAATKSFVIGSGGSSTLAADGNLHQASGEYIELDNLAIELADNSFSISMKAMTVNTNDDWMSMSVADTSGGVTASPMNFIVFGRTNGLVFSYWYGVSGATSGGSLQQWELEAKIPGFSMFAEHTYEFRAKALSDTTGYYSIYIDGVSIVANLPYEFADNTDRKLAWLNVGAASSVWDDLNVSIIPTPLYAFFDSFDTSDTNDVNADIASRQVDSIVESTYAGHLPPYSITNNTMKHAGGGPMWTASNLALPIVGQDFEFSFDVSVPDTSSSWTSIFLVSTNEIDRDVTPFGALILGGGQPGAFDLYYGFGGITREVFPISTNTMNMAFGAPYDKTAEHTVQFISTAGTGGTNAYDFVVDGITIVSGLQYAFSEDSTRQIRIVGTFADGADGAYYNNLKISNDVSAPQRDHVFFDDFNVSDYPHANWGYASRLTNGLVVAPYAAHPQNFSITNGMLHQFQGGILQQDVDLAPYIAGEDFELSFKVTQLDTDGSWSAIYMHDETPGDQRANSSLGCEIYSTGENVYDLHGGIINTPSGPAVTQTELDAAFGTFDRSQEHELRFISLAGAGGSNTYSFIVDGVTMESNIPYQFLGSTRKFGITGTMSNPAAGVYYDDLVLSLYVRPTYEAWASSKGLVAGVNDGREYDAENGGIGDGMVNLLEYAFGGDPLAVDAATYLPAYSGPVDVGGTNYMSYVYRRRSDAGIRGLVYDLQFKTDLVLSPDWTSTLGLAEAGIDDTTDPDFDRVTNSIPTVMDLSSTPGFEEWVWDEQLFLNLEVTEN